MSNFLRVSFFMLLFTGIVMAQENTSPCMTCEELAEIWLPDVRIDSTVKKTNPADHCRVYGVIGPEIGFEVALPDAWNQRFSMSGNGGFAGSIQTSHHRVRQGFANAATDTGHKGDPLDGSWALNRMDRLVNFGHAAVHRTTETAKAIIRHYYGIPPLFSYFVGCSRGGGQAMMAAQRYPDDYDGIIAGAPAFNWPEIAAEYIQNCQVLFPDKQLDQALLTPANLRLLQQLVLGQCDGLDGVEDRIISQPFRCTIDFDKFPMCASEHTDTTCFTIEQVEAIRTIYQGVMVGDQIIHPGFPPGGEALNRGWQAWITGPDNSDLVGDRPTKQFALGTDIFRYFVYHDPTWDYTRYDATSFYTDTRLIAATLNATSVDYRNFKLSGGKMIMYHGWYDPALSAYCTVDHYEATLAHDPEIKDHIRLYMLPGVLHCGGGPGPDGIDWFMHLQNWVEKGEKPDRVLVKGETYLGEIMERPLFPYPGTAVYDGKGNPNVPESYKRFPIK